MIVLKADRLMCTRSFRSKIWQCAGPYEMLDGGQSRNKDCTGVGEVAVLRLVFTGEGVGVGVVDGMGVVSASDLVKIENRSHKQSDSERFYDDDSDAYDPVKTRLSES